MRLLTGKGRWAILLALLDGPANLKTIAERAGMTSTASCHQIKKLKRGGVAVSREEGREVFYSLAE
jgi:predicted transcriptional regulator